MEAEGQREALGEFEVETQGTEELEKVRAAEPKEDAVVQRLTVADAKSVRVTKGEDDAEKVDVALMETEVLPVSEGVRKVDAVVEGLRDGGSESEEQGEAE